MYLSPPPSGFIGIYTYIEYEVSYGLITHKKTILCNLCILQGVKA